MAKDSVNLIIYHSYDLFNIDTTGRRDKSFIEQKLELDKSIHLNEYIFVVNTGDEPKSFWLSAEVPAEPEDGIIVTDGSCVRSVSYLLLILFIFFI